MPNNMDIALNLERISKVIKIACKQSMKDYQENLCKIKQEAKKCLEEIPKHEMFNYYFINSVDILKRQMESTAVNSFN